MAIYKAAYVVFGVIFSLAVAGCATTDQKLSKQYQPVVNAMGGAGELYLAVTDEEPMVLSRGGKPAMRRTVTGEKPVVRDRGGKPTVSKGVTGKWAVVTVKNDYGKKLGIIVTPMASYELLRDAFKQELNAAGFTVKLVNTLPKDVGKGVKLSRVFVDLEQVSGLLTDDGTCRLRISIDLWRNGARLKNIDYESSSSDFAIVDRDQLPAYLVNNVVQAAMKQSIPEIITALEN